MVFSNDVDPDPKDPYMILGLLDPSINKQNKKTLISTIM